MPRSTRRNARWCFPLLLALAAPALSSCSADKKAAKGEIVLALSCDMKIPEDVDQVGIQVSVYGKTVHADVYDVGPDGVRIPATLAIVAGEDPSKPVKIRIWSKQNNKTRTLREVVTTVPPDRVALLHLPIEWLCDGSATDEQGGPVTTCPDPETTCIAGACRPWRIDSATLPAYEPAAVYGGGDPAGGGTCFDTIACFAEGAAVGVNTRDCSTALPTSGLGVNVGMVLPPGADGICGPEACIVPIDKSEEHGWVEENGRIKLPPAVCTRLGDGRALAVALTTACETKTESVPICGPWSTVGADAGTFDAGAPGDVEVPDAAGEDAPLDGPEPDAGDASDGGYVCDPPSDPTKAALCVALVPEAMQLSSTDDTLDGVGTMVVQVLDGEDPKTAQVLDSWKGPPDQGVYGQSPVRFDGLPPGNVYLRAIFYDNSAEVEGAIERGGAWIGGLDFTLGFDKAKMKAVPVAAGKPLFHELQLTALRRLNVDVTAATQPGDDGQGGLFWVAYGTATVVPSSAWFGVGRRPDCVDLESGTPPRVQGYVYGPGPHFLVATLDDRNQLPGEPTATMPGDLEGSMLTGQPDGLGDWLVAQPETVNFDQGQLEQTVAVTLQHVVAAGAAPPYACPTDGGAPDAEPDAEPPDAGVDADDASVPDASADAEPPDAGVDAPDDTTDAQDEPDSSPCVPGAGCVTALSGPCMTGTIACTPDAVCVPDVLPQPETCNGVDDDCDGTVDDGNPGGGMSCEIPAELGPCSMGIEVCNSGNFDCVPLHTALATDVPGNMLDDDCDGVPDDCPLANGTGTYNIDRCDYPVCLSSFFDVNMDPSDGCECAYMGPEVCDGLDNDCNGAIDDGAEAGCAADYPGAADVAAWACRLGVCQIVQCAWRSSYMMYMQDLDHSPLNGCEAVCSPMGSELCNGIDDDCNGIVDDNVMDAPQPPGCWPLPGASCSHGATFWDPPPGATCEDVGSLSDLCVPGVLVCETGVWVCEGSVIPLPETCDGADNDCDWIVDDNLVDESLPCGSAQGACQQGLTQCSGGVRMCAGGQGPAPEICDGVDNDCNGLVDDNLYAGTGCGTSLGACKPGTLACTSGIEQCVGSTGPVSEVCDYQDNDCNESADDGITCN